MLFGVTRTCNEIYTAFKNLVVKSFVKVVCNKKRPIKIGLPEAISGEDTCLKSGYFVAIDALFPKNMRLSHMGI